MKYKLLIGVLLISPSVLAQKFVYNVDFVSYFDNREYHSTQQQSQTLFGMRLSPEIGLSLQDSLGGRHKLMAGLSYIQPFGATWKSAHLIPTIYYQYQQSGFTVNLGAIPYSTLTRALPNYLMSDSLSYAYPNIQGALMQYHSKWGYAEFLCDWRGMQSSTVREAFRLILNGTFKYHWFFVGGIGQINHLAGYSNGEPPVGVCDDVYVNPFIGVDFSNKTPLDSLSLQVGYIAGLQRERITATTYTPQGGKIDLFVRWRFLGLQNQLYVGDNLMPLYAQYGKSLNQGESFYQSHLYNRTDLFVYLVRRSFITCYFSWNFHYTKGEKLGHQQQLIVRFNLDGLKHKTNNLQAFFDK